jgi:adenylate cyclase class IV
MYEVELKVELTNEEREKLINSFKERNFSFKGVTPQNDFYIEAKESQYGGYDFKRYRNENGKFIYTEKIWETTDGQNARKETENEVSKQEFESILLQFPNALKIKKDREWFGGVYQEAAISITIDSVKFDHSPGIRYFIEAEIGVEDKKDVIKTKDLIREFLKDILTVSEIKEAPGMFSLAFKKL